VQLATHEEKPGSVTYTDGCSIGTTYSYVRENIRALPSSPRGMLIVRRGKKLNAAHAFARARVPVLCFVEGEAQEWCNMSTHGTRNYSYTPNNAWPFNMQYLISDSPSLNKQRNANLALNSTMTSPAVTSRTLIAPSCTCIRPPCSAPPIKPPNCITLANHLHTTHTSKLTSA
jgi:hypothetical protein